jgi:choline dehydrogenase-like flavoprotein
VTGNGFDFDVIVIGSGFGGSVAALRATEKGYRVAVLESGRRWPDGWRSGPPDQPNEKTESARTAPLCSAGYW